tara:strand:- start:357 stop:1199 length:843 start_codon:yes stop_codon:yes gene_type:complete
MINSIDHLIIVVKDLNLAAKNYQKVFGIDPIWKGEHDELGTANILFNFKNTYLELLSANGEGLGASLVKDTLDKKGEGLAGIVFGTDDINKKASFLEEKGYSANKPSHGNGINSNQKDIRKWKNLFLPPELTRGLFSFIIEHTEGQLPSIESYPDTAFNKLDHVVINTNDADGFIDIYENVFGIRLALDKVIEHWDSRMLFFRLNKTTIEVVEKKDNKTPLDSLWGLAWEVESIEKAYERLTKEGVEITDIKNGLKENTLVATIKSHTHNVPTLLIEHTK